jgi:hypothetical protein
MHPPTLGDICRLLSAVDILITGRSLRRWTLHQLSPDSIDSIPRPLVCYFQSTCGPLYRPYSGMYFTRLMTGERR